MRFANGSIYVSICADKVHLYPSGTERLFQSLQLHSLIRPKGEFSKSPSPKSAKVNLAFQNTSQRTPQPDTPDRTNVTVTI